MWRLMRQTSDMVEAVAIGAAAACLVHCIGLPVLFAAMPVLATMLPIPDSFHLLALMLAIPATVGALYAGYRRHRVPGPLLGGAVGLVLLTVAATLWGDTPLEGPVTVVGSLFIAAAHLVNWRFRRRPLERAA